MLISCLFKLLTCMAFPHVFLVDFSKLTGPGGKEMRERTEEVRKRKHLSPEVKYQIYEEAMKAEGNGGIGEVIRRYGIHSSDLQRIRRTVEEGAIQAFRERKSRKPKVSHDAHKGVLEENKRLEEIIVEQAAEISLLKKRTRSIYKGI